MILASLIGERLDVKLETVDHNTAFISLALGRNHYGTREGAVGVAVSLRKPELIKLRDAIDSIITNPLEIA